MNSRVLSEQSVRKASFIRRMNADEEGDYALMFAGQGGSAWHQVLEDACVDPVVRQYVERMAKSAERVLAPVASDLLPFAANTDDDATDPAQSVSGIVRAQVAQLVYFDKATAPLLQDRRPVAVLGHSQGVIAARIAEAYLDHDDDAVARYYALARIIGVAASLCTRMLGVSFAADSTPMLSVKGVPVSEGKYLAARFLGEGSKEPAVINAWNHMVFSGRPETLAKLADGIRRMGDRRAAENKVHGGAAFKAVTEFVEVEAPFHSPLMEPAVAQVLQWAGRCGFDEESVKDIAEHILTRQEDWASRTSALADQGVRWIIDMGPGTVLGDMTRPAVEGSGVGLIEAGTPEACDAFVSPDFKPQHAVDWSDHAPRLISLPDGRTVLDTSFTRLTGRSAIMLGGMTPTTVDPAIVAAAANAGHWAELAGGGQVTKEIFYDNMRRLHALLEPGVAVQFNTMRMNPTLWDLHFGSKHIVSKARAAGAPLDGVTISAGVPEEDEAVALINRLHAEGFPYVSLKVGTAAQIRQVLSIADHVPESTIILQVEDGRGGGHHSWESLDSMLLDQYAAIRRHTNIVLAVGGGFGTPDKAARYITGEWAKTYGLRPMPVDAVFVGTVAMAAREALTNPDVKQALVDAQGIDDDAWVRRNAVEGGITSGISSLHADLYELDNAASRCASLLGEIGEAKDPAAEVAARRDEIIKALDATAKPYFGDIADMTYAAWLNRYVELAYPWADPSFATRFARMIERCEQRLTKLDHGEFTARVDLHKATDDPKAVIVDLEQAYPNMTRVTVTQTDIAWFVELCEGEGKPVPFVPVIDDQVAHWWGLDSMWQSQDPRYTADQVIAIPGPVSVKAIDHVDEPVGELLDRFEQGCVDVLRQRGETPVSALVRRADQRTGELITEPDQIIHYASLMFRRGHLTVNKGNDAESREHITYEPVPGRPGVWEEVTHFDNTYWDEHPGDDDAYAVRECRVPLVMPSNMIDGCYPLTDDELLDQDMLELVRAMAGVGTKDICGNPVKELPQAVLSERSPFGEFHAKLHLSKDLGAKHFAVTAGRQLPSFLHAAMTVPDALMCMLWPSLYTSESSGVTDGIPWLESLQSSIHLSHEVSFTHGLTIDSLLNRYRDMAEQGMDVSGGRQLGRPLHRIRQWSRIHRPYRTTPLHQG